MIETAPTIRAVKVGAVGITIEPAARLRDWMRATPSRFATRCLPMLVADQHGWVLLNQLRTTAIWDGRPEPSGLTVTSAGDSTPTLAASHFGSGILTWRLPYLFRSPPGVDLLLRGPANLPKDGAAPLEGVVEADWSPATATMNWQLTRPGIEVTFEVGEPVAMLVPTQRLWLERFTAREEPLGEDPLLAEHYELWRSSRQAFLDDASPSQARNSDWQGDYTRGRIGAASPMQVAGTEHTTRLTLCPFSTAPTH